MSEKFQLLEQFRTSVYNRYQVYNSLFLNTEGNKYYLTGIYIAILEKLCADGFNVGKAPKEIINDFIQKYTDIKDKKELYDLLFQMVKYVERQVVLFDCIEDAAFTSFKRERLTDFLNSEIAKYGMEEISQEHLNVRLVFTAHPTQFYSEKVQTIMGRLRESVRNDDISEIDILLRQLAYTPFVNNKKPTPEDEAANIIYYLRYVYYHTLGDVYARVCNTLNKPVSYNPRLLEMGFWPGGDRDGNPNVTAKTTLKVANLLRNTLMKCYYHQVKYLSARLTFTDTAPLLEDLTSRLYAQIFSFDKLITASYILDVLDKVRALVCEQYQSLYLEEIDNLRAKLYLFGDHFAILDIRQDSSIHRDLISYIYYKETQGSFFDLTSDDQVLWLTSTRLNLPSFEFENDLHSDTIANINQIRTIQDIIGKRGLHRYIISNTETISDVLIIYFLFKGCDYEENQIPIDIVPLFETMEGMRASEGIMRRLFEHPAYRQHLRHRENGQTVMLGFSDGTKDGGYLKANWEIYQTKVKLTRLANEYGVKVTFFDGRGGPPARGGGKTHQFYASQGSEISGDHIHLTIQGQTITSVFGTSEHSSFHIEQLILSLLSKQRLQINLTQHQKNLLQALADASYEKYLKLKSHPQFIPYLERMTTLRFYGETNIASRPTKRNVNSKLQLKDLRAIPFVGSWSLARQNVPGYYGLGTALEKYKDKEDQIKSLYRECPYFRTLIDNSMMSLKKSFFPLTAYLSEHKEFGIFIRELRDEFELTKFWLLKINGQNELMENEVISKASIEMRSKIIMPLITIQQYALQEIEAGSEDKELLEKLIIRCMFGNINASRNSA